MRKIELYPSREQLESRNEKIRNFLIDTGDENNHRKLTSASKIILLILIVSLIVTITYWPVFHSQAICFDDQQYFIHNNLISRLQISSIYRFIVEIKPSTVAGYYQPITMISLMCDYFLATGRTNNLWLFHRTNLILHLFNCALIILFLYLLFKNFWVAAFVALLFGIHPLTVEPVVWVSERKTLLATFFSLGALICYLRAILIFSKKYYFLAFFLFLLALMSKPTCVFLPLAMILIDIWPLERLNKQALLEKIPFCFLSIIFVIITYISQKSSGWVISPQNTVIFSGNNFFLGLPLVLSYDFLFYISKFLFPVNLTPHYPIPMPFSLHNPLLLGSFIFSFVLLILGMITFRKSKPFLVGCFIFIIIVLPTSGVVGFTRALTSDKYAYLPIIVGPLLPLTWFGSQLYNKKLDPIKHLQRKICLIILIVVLAFIEVRTTQNYLKQWKDTVTLFQHMTKMAPKEAETYAALGEILVSKGRIDDAIISFRRALKMHLPIYNGKKLQVSFYNDLGMALITKREYGEAYTCFQKMIVMDPKNEQGYGDLGILYAKRGQYPQAIKYFKQASKMNSENCMYFYYIAKLYYNQGDKQKGDRYYKKFSRLSRTKGISY